MPADQLIYIVDDDEAVRDSLSQLLGARATQRAALRQRPNFSPPRRPCARVA